MIVDFMRVKCYTDATVMTVFSKYYGHKSRCTMNIANEIKYIRQNCFFSQQSFADELGISYSTVNRWETGKTVPNCTMMRKIVDFCKTHDLDYHKVDAAWKELKNGINPY